MAGGVSNAGSQPAPPAAPVSPARRAPGMGRPRCSASRSSPSTSPAALQLRLLQTVVEVAAEKNSTLVLPFPVELLRFLERATPASAASPPPAPPPPPPPPLPDHERRNGVPPVATGVMPSDAGPTDPG